MSQYDDMMRLNAALRRGNQGLMEKQALRIPGLSSLGKGLRSLGEGLKNKANKAKSAWKKLSEDRRRARFDPSGYGKEFPKEHPIWEYGVSTPAILGATAGTGYAGYEGLKYLLNKGYDWYERRRIATEEEIAKRVAAAQRLQEAAKLPAPAAPAADKIPAPSVPAKDIAAAVIDKKASWMLPYYPSGMQKQSFAWLRSKADDIADYAGRKFKSWMPGKQHTNPAFRLKDMAKDQAEDMVIDAPQAALPTPKAAPSPVGAAQNAAVGAGNGGFGKWWQGVKDKASDLPGRALETAFTFGVDHPVLASTIGTGMAMAPWMLLGHEADKKLSERQKGQPSVAPQTPSGQNSIESILNNPKAMEEIRRRMGGAAGAATPQNAGGSWVDKYGIGQPFYQPNQPVHPAMKQLMEQYANQPRQRLTLNEAAKRGWLNA